MIVRLTVKDNDFSDVLCRFMSSFYVEVVWGCPLDDKSINFKEYKYFNELLNPNCDHKLTEEETELLINRIKTSFENYLKKIKSISEGTRDYLMSRLDVKIIKSLTDKWENSEVVYWLQHSGKVVNQ